ncbi:MAG TPA: tRNA lysidine(34) synthetase TilS [Anaerolineales bacterium]
MNPAARVAEFIRREKLLQPGQRVVVGVSGGPDSLCLLGCLRQLGYRPLIAHLDHGWRPGSWQEAEFVLGLARSLGLPAVVERIQAAGPLGRSSREERARRARYEFLARVAAEHKVEAVAVGHTADDQAETVVMHWLRGAGPEGLRGMLPATDLSVWAKGAPARSLRLVRPLLELRREETEAYCRAAGWEPRRDESNMDLSFLRNRIRHQVLPSLEAQHKGLRNRLSRTAQLMREVSDLVDALAIQREAEIVHPAGEGVLRLSRVALRQEPAAIQRAILRRAIRRLRPDVRDIGFEAVDMLLGLLVGEGDRRSIVGGIQVHPFGEDLLLVAPGAEPEFLEFPQVAGAQPRELLIPGRVELANGWAISARRSRRVGSRRVRPRSAEDELRVDLDAGRVAGSLRLRPPRPGDRIRPLGMEGRIKVSDLLSQNHVPAPARARWPLVVSEAEIVWVVGVRMADGTKLTGSSRRVIVLEVRKPGAGG